MPGPRPACERGPGRPAHHMCRGRACMLFVQSPKAEVGLAAMRCCALCLTCCLQRMLSKPSKPSVRCRRLATTRHSQGPATGKARARSGRACSVQRGSVQHDAAEAQRQELCGTRQVAGMPGQAYPPCMQGARGAGAPAACALLAAAHARRRRGGRPLLAHLAVALAAQLLGPLLAALHASLWFAQPPAAQEDPQSCTAARPDAKHGEHSMCTHLENTICKCFTPTRDTHGTPWLLWRAALVAAMLVTRKQLHSCAAGHTRTPATERFSLVSSSS